MKKDIGPAAQAMTTLFERILSGEIPSHEVAKGDGWYAFLDIFRDGKVHARHSNPPGTALGSFDPR